MSLNVVVSQQRPELHVDTKLPRLYFPYFFSAIVFYLCRESVPAMPKNAVLKLSLMDDYNS